MVELEKLETAFIRILGLKPLYFRPPYGNYNDLVLKVLSERGYKKLFLWSEDSGELSCCLTLFSSILPLTPSIPRSTFNVTPLFYSRSFGLIYV
jgi:peptidoglycan/xylan/chitin deacetylase (PgdA/CDA1 family)